MADVISTHADKVGFFAQPQDPVLFCEMNEVGSIETPNRVTPDVSFVSDFFNDKIELGGEDVEFWTFRADNGDKLFPAPLRRVRAGQIFHNRIETSKHVHTIHHHGLEPGPHDDGVPHMSFATSGNYTYQIRPMDPGTYFYHCHVNTPLHFEMGMYGGFIVDPKDGPGKVYDDPATRYDVEAFWAMGGWDLDKHELNQAAGFEGEDVGLNVWVPDYLHINGAFGSSSESSRRVTINAQTGQTVALRLLNAGYSICTVRFPLDAELIGSDGRQFQQSFVVRDWIMSGAERYEAMLRPTAPGTYPIEIEYHHYITGNSVGKIVGNLVVTGPDVTPPPPIVPPVQTDDGREVIIAPPVMPEKKGETATVVPTAPKNVDPSIPVAYAEPDHPAVHHPATKKRKRVTVKQRRAIKRHCKTVRNKKRRKSCVTKHTREAQRGKLRLKRKHKH
jgi:FtsP/CotA-like multicopper oxidase with cupredoxin domain